MQQDLQSPVTLRRNAEAEDKGLARVKQEASTTGMEKVLDCVSTAICAPFKKTKLWLGTTLDKDTTGCWETIKKLHAFLSESKEYSDPHEYGWRIKRRRMFLIVGTVLYTCLTVYQGTTRDHPTLDQKLITLDIF